MRAKRWASLVIALLLAAGGCSGVSSLNEICDNGQDDDEDGLVDCQDTSCSDAPSCQFPEICGNDLDDDEDGDADCADSDCVGDPICVEICNNGLDDDVDGNIDCMDIDCSEDPACPEICDNGLDDDADGLVDCADYACTGTAPCDGGLCESDDDCASGFCLSEEETGFPIGYCSTECEPGGSPCPGGGLCADPGLGTGFICLDPCNFVNGTEGDCREGYECIDLDIPDPTLGACLPGCTSDEQCGDGECIPDPARPGIGFCARDEVCADDFDNDRDGDTDCADTDCLGDPACP